MYGLNMWIYIQPISCYVDIELSFLIIYGLKMYGGSHSNHSIRWFITHFPINTAILTQTPWEDLYLWQCLSAIWLGSQTLYVKW